MTLKHGDVKELDAIKVHLRPFYFDSVSNKCTRAKADGTVKITRTAVNTTGSERPMLFMGVMDSTHRTDHSSFYGLSASYQFDARKWVLLKQGGNTVTFNPKTISKALKGIYEYWIVGADAVELPLTPYMDALICCGVTDALCGSGLSAETHSAKDGTGSGGMRIVPTKVSSDGEVLERGALPK